MINKNLVTQIKNLLKIIELIISISLNYNQNIVFRNYQHIKINARLKSNFNDIKIYLNPNCSITLGDRAIFITLSDFESRIRKQESLISIRDYNNKIINATKYIIINLYLSKVINKKAAIAKVQIKIHFTNNFKVNMLFDIDVFTLYKFVLNCASQSIIINNYQDIKIFARFIVKSHSQIKRVLKTKIIITLLSNMMINISINYYDILSDDRDFLFESELVISLNKDNEVFAHVIDCLLTFVQIKNTIKALIILFKNIRLNTVIKYAANDYYQVFYKLASLATYK